VRPSDTYKALSICENERLPRAISLSDIPCKSVLQKDPRHSSEAVWSIGDALTRDGTLSGGVGTVSQDSSVWVTAWNKATEDFVAIGVG
jgi:hypothetical protein